MHIHRFSYDYAPPSGGLGPGVLGLTKAQRSLGHTLEVFAGEWPHQRGQRDEGLRVYRLPRTLPRVGPFFTYGPAAALRWIWSDATPDVVHGHNHHSPHASVAAGSARSWSYVVHLHATAAARRSRVQSGAPALTRQLEWRGAELAERLACRAADAIVCVSESVADEAVRFYGADPDRITVVLNGVDLELFTPHGPNMRRELGLTHHRVILFVGSLNSRKRLDLLVRALLSLPQDHALVIAGSGPDREALGELVAMLSLDDRVHFVGPVPQHELPKYYRTADLFCLVSTSEGFPKVVLEALACGVPVASTRSFGPGPLRDEISWLHAVTAEGLAEELAALPEERASAGRSSCLLGDFTWDAVARRLDQVYAAVR